MKYFIGKRSYSFTPFRKLHSVHSFLPLRPPPKNSTSPQKTRQPSVWDTASRKATPKRKNFSLKFEKEFA
jgi:hypothetical protein